MRANNGESASSLPLSASGLAISAARLAASLLKVFKAAEGVTLIGGHLSLRTNLDVLVTEGTFRLTASS